jgi:HPt (histidine-containing phosphotransfer) domain-containing protein
LVCLPPRRNSTTCGIFNRVKYTSSVKMPLLSPLASDYAYANGFLPIRDFICCVTVHLSNMTNADIDTRILSEFLDLGGRDMRQALLSQVRSDLTRCHASLAEFSAASDMAALCRTAHEIKGIAATIGALSLSALAEKSEAACSSRRSEQMAALLPDLRHQTQITAQALSSFMQV